MEYLAKMGLPDPRAKYDVEYALKSDPTLSSMLNSVASTQSERDTMRKEFEDRIKRTKKYREDDLKNQDADRRETEKYQSATKQALNDYFSEMSQYGSERNARAATAPAPPAPPTEAEAYAERNREGPPGWLKALPGNALDAVKGMPDYFKDLGGAAVSPPDLGVPNRAPLGTNLGFREGPDVINGITKPEMNLPRRPITADMKMGLDPEGYSMMDQILGRPMRDVVGYNKRRAADEAIDPATRAQMYMAQQRGVDKRSSSAALRYLLGLAPTVVAGRQGRTPATDAIQQRLSPLYQMGALGQ